MATEPEIPTLFQNNFGFMLTFDLKTDLTTATAFMVRIVKPVVSGQREVVEHLLTQAAVLNPTAGIVGYVVAEDDLDRVGSYLIQLEDVTPGRRLTTKEQRFTVKPTVERFKPV